MFSGALFFVGPVLRLCTYVTRLRPLFSDRVQRSTEVVLIGGHADRIPMQGILLKSRSDCYVGNIVEVGLGRDGFKEWQLAECRVGGESGVVCSCSVRARWRPCLCSSSTWPGVGSGRWYCVDYSSICRCTYGCMPERPQSMQRVRKDDTTNERDIGIIAVQLFWHHLRERRFKYAAEVSVSSELAICTYLLEKGANAHPWRNFCFVR